MPVQRRGAPLPGVLLVLYVIIGLPARADFRVDFDTTNCLQKLVLDRQDATHFRLDAAAGHLVLQTQPGDIYQEFNNCRNFFHVPAPAGDFEAILSVARFEPTKSTQHLSLGILQNNDKLVRLTCWWSGQGRSMNLDREDNAVQAAVKTGPVDFGDRLFRLRLTRRGSSIAAAWARGAEPWSEWGSVAWDGQVRRIGFYAANGTSPDCPETEAILDSFEVLCEGGLPASEPAEILPPPLITEEDLVQHRGVRGFNYVPSNAVNGLVMWREFNAELWDRELSWVEKLKGNAIRIWLDPRAFDENASRFVAAFEQALAIAARHKLRVIPTLFNCWPSVRPAEWGFGHLGPVEMAVAKLRRYEPYVRTIVGNHRDDQRVLMWDVVNEPEPAGEAGAPFIQYYCGYIRALGTTRPITIGFADWRQNERFAGLLDVLTLHIYARDEAGHEGAINGLKAIGRRFGKPVVCNECVVGAVDDEQHRLYTVAAVAAMEKNAMGYLVWALVDGHIAAARPDREEGANSYQSFFHTDGAARPAVSVLRW